MHLSEVDLSSRKGEGFVFTPGTKVQMHSHNGHFESKLKRKRNHESVQPVRDEWMDDQCFYLSSTTFNLQPLSRKENILKHNKWQTAIFRYLMSKRQSPQNVYNPGELCPLSKISFMLSTFNSVVARTQRDFVEERWKFVLVGKQTAPMGLQNTERIIPLTYHELIRWFVASLSG